MENLQIQENNLPKPYYEESGITIYHGDCREILPKLRDESVDMILTDPPYGHNNKEGDLSSHYDIIMGKNNAAIEINPIKNDGIEIDLIIRWFFSESKRLLVKGGCCCCCGGGGGPDPQFARWSLWLDEIMPFKMCVIWDKGRWGLGWHYRRNWECILIAQKLGDSCKWYMKDGVPNVIDDCPKIEKSTEGHPTIKPVKLMSKFIEYHSQIGELVCDPFMGSGTTLLAAKSLGRKAIGIEIEEKYCEMAIKRLRQEYFDFNGNR